MITIPINRASIRPNTFQAKGGGLYLSPTRETITTIQIAGSVPLELLKRLYGHLRFRGDLGVDGRGPYVGGEIILPIEEDLLAEIEQLIQGKQLQAVYNRVTETQEGNFNFNEPDYRYTYLTTRLKCGSCGNKVSVGDIDRDYVQCNDDGDECPQDTCPVCEAINSFPEYEYERFNRAMAQQKPPIKP